MIASRSQRCSHSSMLWLVSTTDWPFFWIRPMMVHKFLLGGRWLGPASLAGDLPGHGVHPCTRLVQEDQRWLPGLAVGRGGKGPAQDSHQGHGHIQLPLVATAVAP